MSGVLFLTHCEKAVKPNRLLKENLPTCTRPFSFVRPVRWKFLKCQLFHGGSLVSSLEHHVLFTQPVGFRKKVWKDQSYIKSSKKNTVVIKLGLLVKIKLRLQLSVPNWYGNHHIAGSPLSQVYPHAFAVLRWGEWARQGEKNSAAS